MKVRGAGFTLRKEVLWCGDSSKGSKEFLCIKGIYEELVCI